MNPAYRLGWLFFRAVYRLYFRWRVYHPERVPARGPLILAANHASLLDPPLVGAGLGHAITYLARDTLFRFPPAGALLRAWNSVPVDREGGGAAGIKVTLACLRAGGSVILFPEGTRTYDGRLQRARAGIGLIVVKSGAPVVPVRVFGTFGAMGRGVWFPRPRRIAVKYGMPLHFDALNAKAQTASKERQREIYQQIADEIMVAIAKLEPCEDRRTFP
jgi:1-acyl-sn-glycerol-3-phosphate acyltransferase